MAVKTAFILPLLHFILKNKIGVEYIKGSVFINQDLLFVVAVGSAEGHSHSNAHLITYLHMIYILINI